jgi:hypothetical protein
MHWCVAKTLKGLIFSCVICLKIDTWHIIMSIKKTKWKLNVGLVIVGTLIKISIFSSWVV